MNPKFPLLEKKIIVTRSKEQQKQFSDSLQNLGAQIIDLPVLLIGEPDDLAPLDKAIQQIEQFDWVIFSSGNGVRSVESRMLKLGTSLLNYSGRLKVAAVGKQTSRILFDMGINVDFVPPEFVSDSLLEHFPKSKKSLKLLIPRVQTGGRQNLSLGFKKLGFDVIEVPAYESRCPSEIPSQIIDYFSDKVVHAIAFTSAKTASYTAVLLRKHFGHNWLNKLENVKIISIGPQTSSSCMQHFNKVDKEAEPHDMDGLSKACISIFQH